MEKAKHLPGSGETPAQRGLAVQEDEPGFAGGGAELPLGEPAERGAPCDANRGGTCQIDQYLQSTWGRRIPNLEFETQPGFKSKGKGRVFQTVKDSEVSSLTPKTLRK